MDCILSCTSPAPSRDQGETDSGIGLEYLAEGAAHIVYRITSLPDTSLSARPEFAGKLFRFRKEIASGVPCAQTVSNFQNRIAPLFPAQNLVELELYRMPDPSAWTEQLNAALRQRETNGSRSAHRRGVYLSSSEQEQNVILMTDLSSRAPHEVLLEFKPKWLVQSPSAPATARRCRTCAVREMRTEDSKLTQKRYTGRGHAKFCPFDLLSEDDDVLKEGISLLSLTNGASHLSLSTYKSRVQPLLFRLRDAQAEHCNVGLKNFEDGANHDFSLSMALRDCSVFVKSSADERGREEIRLADFDRKTSSGGKLEQWMHNERRLIREGWYTGTEPGDSKGQRLCRALQPS